MPASARTTSRKFVGLPERTFLHNALESAANGPLNALAVNEDDVVVSGGDNGSLWFWDYKSGHCFQQAACKVQPGSMRSPRRGCSPRASIATGHAGSSPLRGGDKTIKMWLQDEDAEPEETHPNLPFHPPRDLRRF